jgi:hypothetical protein
MLLPVFRSKEKICSGQGGDPNELNGEFRRCIGVGVAVEDMRHGIEVQIAGTGKNAGERPPQHRVGEHLVAGKRLVGIERRQVELIRAVHEVGDHVPGGIGETHLGQGVEVKGITP